MVDILQKRLVVFDLDGTLATSKLAIDNEMSALLVRLLARRPAAVIGGGSYQQFQNQLIATLTCPDEEKSRLYLFPTNSTQCYRFENGSWQQVYVQQLREDEKEKIRTALAETFREHNYHDPEKLYGVPIEDRITQISFSPLGQQAPVAEKEAWRAQHDALRLAMRDTLQRLLPDFEVRAGGITTIDITRKGIDKGYGLHQIEKFLNIPIADMVYVGDALYPGGNDVPARDAGAEAVPVNGPAETKQLIEQWLTVLEK